MAVATVPHAAAGPDCGPHVPITISVSVTPFWAEPTPSAKATTKTRTKSLFMSLLSPRGGTSKVVRYGEGTTRPPRRTARYSRAGRAPRTRHRRPGARGGGGRPVPGRALDPLYVGAAEQPVRPQEQHEDH